MVELSVFVFFGFLEFYEEIQVYYCREPKQHEGIIGKHDYCSSENLCWIHSYPEWRPLAYYVQIFSVKQSPVCPIEITKEYNKC